jgi:hypothetical protein
MLLMNGNSIFLTLAALTFRIELNLHRRRVEWPKCMSRSSSIRKWGSAAPYFHASPHWRPPSLLVSIITLNRYHHVSHNIVQLLLSPCFTSMQKIRALRRFPLPFRKQHNMANTSEFVHRCNNDSVYGADKYSLVRLAQKLVFEGPHKAERTSRRVRGLFNGKYAFDTTNAYHVWEVPNYPQ